MTCDLAERVGCGKMLAEYLRHYNEARLHRSLGQFARLKLTPIRLNRSNLAEFRICRKQVLSGLTHEYCIAA